MKPIVTLSYEFVEHIPDILKEQTVYVSIPYATVAHKCCCGCGSEVITPLSPTDWSLIFDGESISLTPSIGNWGFECQSHYWIKNNRVEWARQWSQEEIVFGRMQDSQIKGHYFSNKGHTSPALDSGQEEKNVQSQTLLQKLIRWLF